MNKTFAKFAIALSVVAAIGASTASSAWAGPRMQPAVEMPADASRACGFRTGLGIDVNGFGVKPAAADLACGGGLQTDGRRRQP